MQLPVKYFVGFAILLSVLSASCNRQGYREPANPLFTALPAGRTGIGFANHVEGSAALNIFKYHSFFDGGGVAIGDVNNDGLADIFLVANQGASKLYLNKGSWHFEDITGPAGLSAHKAWSTGVAMADVNGDGLLDIYICNSGLQPGEDRANQLFINRGVHNGMPSFREEAARYGLADKGMTTQAAFFDYDGDGDLDCFMLNNTLNPNANFGYNHDLRNTRDTVNGQKLYRNDDGRFTDVTLSAGIHNSVIGFGLGITTGDVNGDKRPDIYVANDFYERDYLYLNNGDGTFSDVINAEMGHISQTSMGADMADINNDGRQDIFSTDMLPEDDYRLKTTARYDDYNVANAKLDNDFHHQFMRNMLQLNNGDSTFSEIGQLAGVEATDWTWGPLLFDFDNDGWKDIFVANGIYRDITDQDFLDFFGNEATMREVAEKGVFDFKDFEGKIPSHPIANYAFLNEHDLRFRNEAYRLGLGMPGFSNGAAYGDLDNDGDLDLVVNNDNMPCFVYRNNAQQMLHHHFLRIRLKGAGKNPSGIGAEVTCYAGRQKITLLEMPQRGFQSSVDPTLVFGLGTIPRLDSLRVIWPGSAGRMQVLYAVKADQTLLLDEKKAGRSFEYRPPAYAPFFENVSAKALAGDARHLENNYIDFDREHLMPLMLSTEGPKCAVKDINNDGREDFFIGGAKGDAGKIFLQTADGRFRRQNEPALAADKGYEDTGAAFFDADGDGDPDLMIASGGNEDQAGSSALMPRLYLNDGHGLFSPAAGAVPQDVSANASCLRACDVDNDGDMDVFIGGRDVPGIYGATPESFLLLNDGKGHFTDATDRLAPGLQRIGMVTDASWTDVDGDGKPDLVIAGEWMPVTIYHNLGKRLGKWVELPNSNGWWNCIKAADLNGDGRMDFILGNLGLNAKFKADAAHPVQAYINDFDKNGTIEPVLTYYKSDSISYPMSLKGDMVLQMPSLKKKFLKYADYAGKTLRQVFTPEEMKGAIVRSACQLQSCILLNRGNGKFDLRPLPLRAQFSPVFGIVADDLDGDGRKDLFLAGNFYSVKPEIGRYDASYGVFLKGDGNGHFSYRSPGRTGLFVKGEVRDAAVITGKDKRRYILVCRNNDTAMLFRQKDKGF